MGLVAAAAMLAACGPALNWRQLQPEDWSLSVVLPCRPQTQERELPLAGGPVRMRLLSCEADGQLFAVSSADMGDPARVGPALVAMAASARTNLRADLLLDQPAAVPGMTPNTAARVQYLAGHRGDGSPLQLRQLLFAHGTRVYQATVVGATVADAASAPLFDSLALAR